MLKLIEELKVRNSELINENKELIKNEVKFHKVFDESPVGSVMVNLDKCFIKCNTAFCNFLGYTETELIGKSISSVTYREDIEPGMSDMTKMVDGKIDSTKIEKRYLRKDGNIVWGEVNIRLVRNANKKPLYFLTIILDITQHKTDQQLLKENEEKYRLMFSNNPQPMFIYDPETLYFLEVNQAAVNHYGYSKEEFLSMSVKDIRPAEDIPILLKEINQTRFVYNPVGEWRHKKKSGEVIFVNITSSSVINNGKNARQVIVYDITERRQAEQALKESEEKYKELFEANSDGITIYSIDENGYPLNILNMNENAARMLGYAKEELLVI